MSGKAPVAPHKIRSPRLVLALLVVLTFAALTLTTAPLQDLLGIREAAALAAVLAFVKARFVVSDFMELRGSRQQWLFDVWVIVVGAGSVVLFLR